MTKSKQKPIDIKIDEIAFMETCLKNEELAYELMKPIATKDWLKEEVNRINWMKNEIKKAKQKRKDEKH